MPLGLINDGVSGDETGKAPLRVFMVLSTPMGEFPSPSPSRA